MFLKYFYNSYMCFLWVFLELSSMQRVTMNCCSISCTFEKVPGVVKSQLVFPYFSGLWGGGGLLLLKINKAGNFESSMFNKLMRQTLYISQYIEHMGNKLPGVFQQNVICVQISTVIPSV